MSTESYEDTLERLGELLRYTLTFAKQMRHLGLCGLWNDRNHRSLPPDTIPWPIILRVEIKVCHLNCVIWKGELMCSCKSDLGKVAAAKIEKLFGELEEHKSNKSSDAVERIRSGFIHFKTHKYLYVLFRIPYTDPSILNTFQIQKRQTI